MEDYFFFTPNASKRFNMNMVANNEKKDYYKEFLSARQLFHNGGENVFSKRRNSMSYQ